MYEKDILFTIEFNVFLPPIETYANIIEQHLFGKC